MRQIALKAVLGVCAFVFTASAQDAAKESLWAAAKAGDAATVEGLLATGADVNATNPKEYGKTALHLAAEKGHANVVRALLSHKADVHVKESFYKDTALAWATYARHAEVVALLIEADADGADAVLYTAQRRGDLDLMRIMLENGKVKPETLSRCLAQAQGHPEIVTLLEKAGAKLAPLPGDPIVLELMAAVVGTYIAETGGSLDLTSADGKLLVRAVGQTIDELRSQGNDALLSVANPTMTYQVQRDGERVASLVVTIGETKRTYQRDDRRNPASLPSSVASEASGPIVPRNWPSFRGRNASGVADDQWPPVTWDVEKGTNVRWKTPIPGLGNGCPIVWNDHIFVTSAVRLDGGAELKVGIAGDIDSVNDASEHSWCVYCLDRQTGRIVWEKEASRGVPQVKRHAKATHADCTPATDGTHVVVSFGSEGLYCYDLSGRQLWKKDLGTLDAGWFFNTDFQWGYGSSPIIYRDLVIVQCDVRERSFIAAYRLADGSEAWRTPRDEFSSWGTPTIVQGPERDELVTNASRFARGYDPLSGAELWRLAGHSEITVPTPVFGENLIVIADGYHTPRQPIYAIRPGARGDLSLAEGQTANDFVAWSTQKGGPYMSSPIVYRGRLYTCGTQGVVTIYEVGSGKIVFGPKRLPGGGMYTASLVAADGKVYFTSEDGAVRAMQAHSPFAWLADNPLGEPCLATPAIAAGMIFFRTKSNAIAIGRPN